MILNKKIRQIYHQNDLLDIGISLMWSKNESIVYISDTYTFTKM